MDSKTETVSDRLIKLLKGFCLNKKDTQYAYEMGYDCGKNGPSETNCHFSIFSSPENTKAWEKGKEIAEFVY